MARSLESGSVVPSQSYMVEHAAVGITRSLRMKGHGEVLHRKVVLPAVGQALVIVSAVLPGEPLVGGLPLLDVLGLLRFFSSSFLLYA
jgi:hypothetical protein